MAQYISQGGIGPTTMLPCDSGSLTICFDPTTVWYAVKTGKRGYSESFSESAIQTCLTRKVLFGLPLGQTMGLVASLIQMAGLDWPDSDSSTLCRRQARLAVQISYCSPGEPVTLHVDSTGIKFRDHGERQVHKHGASRRMQWREAYIGMDERTGDVRAACFNLSRQGGSLFLLNLLKQIPEGEKIGSVTADAAYDTRGCHGVVVNRGAGARTSSARSVAHGTVWLPASATTSFTRHDA